MNKKSNHCLKTVSYYQGWNLPYDSNFTQTVYYDQILNKEAANLLYQTLESYNLEYDVITDYVIAR
jgi:hypothetical protein